jgi:hypothetical protein
MRQRLLHLFLPAILLACPLSAEEGSAPPDAFKFYVAEPGVYRATYEDLEGAGLAAPVDAAALGLSCAGEPVPIRVEDGGDGSFGPGDFIEFVGEHLQGDNSYFNQHSRLNIYRLKLRADSPARMTPVSGDACGAGTGRIGKLHLEQDTLRVRFDIRADDEEEVWFWEKLTQIAKQPFRQTIVLDDLALETQAPVSLRAHLRGWSELPHELKESHPDHRVELTINERPAGSIEWSNRSEGEWLDLPDLDPSLFRSGANEIGLRVPKRRIGDDRRPVVDVVLLNWIEVRYPRSPTVAEGQARILRSDTTGCVRVGTDPGVALGAYLPDGGYLLAADGGERLVPAWEGPRAGEPLAVVAGNRYLEPPATVADPGSDLATRPRQADYIMIAHPSLLDAIRPLAEFHSGRGLAVEVVDVADIYDEFNHGIVHPRAIRSFLAHARREWSEPAPRFVLLVGDASWDVANEAVADANYADWTFMPGQRGRLLPKNESTPYAENPEQNVRGLVPTYSYGTREGHAASDNWFVNLDDRDLGPEMAIGRFPVVEPAEVEAIVKKTIGYVSSAPVGEWRRRVLWITNESRVYQRQSDQLAETLATSGFDPQKVYPVPEEPSNEAHRATLLNAFNEGQYVVHFIGHGGRYIWRTGPPDLEKNRDLFTLDDLDLLKPTGRLPIVFSMTCYSAPFDHPNADSIGEKFLRLSDKGAVAVLAAAWRNSPNIKLSRLLMDSLVGGETLGEVVMQAKRRSKNVDFVRQYNLLGDPALPLGLPSLELSLELTGVAPPTVRGTLDGGPVVGRALVEWVAAGGEAIQERTVVVDGSQFESIFDGDPASLAELKSVRVYLVDSAGKRDGVAGLKLPALVEPVGEAAAALTPETEGANQ